MPGVKCFVPAISVEGFEEATDFRRGKGTYQKAVAAMELFKRMRLPFGISCCYIVPEHRGDRLQSIR